MAWIDEDRDGRHDLTGDTQEQYMDRTRRRQAELDALGRYDDANGDGRNDANGETYEEFRTRREAGETYEEVRDRYDTSGQSQRDLDAGRGRDPRYYGAGANGAGASGGSGGGGGNDSEGSALDAYYDASADIPVWGWLSGANARRDAQNASDEAAQARLIWSDLDRFMPSADDLAVQYEEEGSVGGPETSIAGSGDPESEAIERRALAGLMDIGESGGITDSDRARMQLGAMDVGRQARASREADMAALQARGMGGSGTQIASTLGASQAGIDGLYQRDAEIQARAQDRAMDALSQGGSFAGQMRGERFREGGAQDDLNRWNTDYQRGREQRNTGWRNRTRESRSDARQQQYENRERQAAGMTEQWQAASSGARADQRRRDESDQAQANFIAGWADL